MSSPITLILAGDMDQGREIMTSCNLNQDHCAVINRPDYLNDVILNQGEVVFIHTEAPSNLFTKLNNLLKSSGCSRINLAIVNPIT